MRLRHRAGRSSDREAAANLEEEEDDDASAALEGYAPAMAGRVFHLHPLFRAALRQVAARFRSVTGINSCISINIRIRTPLARHYRPLVTKQHRNQTASPYHDSFVSYQETAIAPGFRSRNTSGVNSMF
jgi:hypothetical protein